MGIKTPLYDGRSAIILYNAATNEKVVLLTISKPASRILPWRQFERKKFELPRVSYPDAYAELASGMSFPCC